MDWFYVGASFVLGLIVGAIIVILIKNPFRKL